MREELLDRISDYLTGRLQLRDFELLIVGNLQKVLDSRESKAITTINEIDVLLVQLGDDVITPQEFALHLQVIRSTEWFYRFIERQQQDAHYYWPHSHADSTSNSIKPSKELEFAIPIGYAVTSKAAAVTSSALFDA